MTIYNTNKAQPQIEHIMEYIQSNQFQWNDKDWKTNIYWILNEYDFTQSEQCELTEKLFDLINQQFYIPSALESVRKPKDIQEDPQQKDKD